MQIEDVTPDVIKEIRSRYCLSQQSFARLLGIGEASIVRYENGQKPSKANANLIRAAADPSFMKDCIRRDGALIPEAQRKRAEQIVYIEIQLNKEGEIMDMTDRYLLTLDQEILNEQAAEILGDLMRFMDEAENKGDEVSAMIFNDLFMYLSQVKFNITCEEFDSRKGYNQLRGSIETVRHLANSYNAKAA